MAHLCPPAGTGIVLGLQTQSSSAIRPCLLSIWRSAHLHATDSGDRQPTNGGLHRDRGQVCVSWWHAASAH